MTWRNLLRVALAALVALTATEDSDGDEEPSFDELDIVNSPATKTESLERTLDRAESVLESQLTTLAAIQDKAVRMVRVKVILLGVIASIAQVASNPVPVNGWLKVGGILVVSSVVAGIRTSSSPSPDFGPGPSYVRPNIDSGESNEDVYLKLLQGYREAISYNRSVVNDSAKYLFVTQTLLVAGIITGVIGVIVF